MLPNRQGVLRRSEGHGLCLLVTWNGGRQLSFASLLSRPSAKCREKEAREHSCGKGANMDGLPGAEFLRKSPILQQDRTGCLSNRYRYLPSTIKYVHSPLK